MHALVRNDSELLGTHLLTMETTTNVHTADELYERMPKCVELKILWNHKNELTAGSDSSQNNVATAKSAPVDHSHIIQNQTNEYMHQQGQDSEEHTKETYHSVSSCPRWTVANRDSRQHVAVSHQFSSWLWWKKKTNRIVNKWMDGWSHRIKTNRIKRHA